VGGFGEPGQGALSGGVGGGSGGGPRRARPPTWRVLLAARLMLRRPGTRHSLMRWSGRMWRSPLAWTWGWEGAWRGTGLRRPGVSTGLRDQSSCERRRAPLAVPCPLPLQPPAAPGGSPPTPPPPPPPAAWSRPPAAACAASRRCPGSRCRSSPSPPRQSQTPGDSSGRVGRVSQAGSLHPLGRPPSSLARPIPPPPRPPTPPSHTPFPPPHQRRVGEGHHNVAVQLVVGRPPQREHRGGLPRQRRHRELADREAGAQHAQRGARAAAGCGGRTTKQSGGRQAAGIGWELSTSWACPVQGPSSACRPLPYTNPPPKPCVQPTHRPVVQ
jgi:hypothetical protein